MPLGALAVMDTYDVPRQTQTANTPIIGLVPPRKGKRSKVTFLQYTSGATAHTGTIMREKGRSTLTAAVAAAATVLILKNDPGVYSTSPEWAGTGPFPPTAGQPLGRGVTPSAADNGIAANDYVVLKMGDGQFAVIKVTSVVTNGDGTVSLTVPAIGNAGAPKGATVWFMGVAGDVTPHDNKADDVLKPGTSATTVYPNAAGAGGSVIAQSWHQESPLLLFFDNITAASTLDYASANYGT